MSKYSLIYLLLISTCTYATEITYSVMPIVEQAEIQPAAKYSERHIKEINQVLDKKSEKIRIVTYNILFDLFDDKLADKGQSWQARLPWVIKSIENMKPDIFCVQEAYSKQLADLMVALEKTHTCYIGSSTTGELNAIFYNKNRFDLDVEQDSASYDLPLNSQDDAYVATIPGFLCPELEPGKQMTVAHLVEKATRKEFVVMNTHLTYSRVNSREDQARFISALAGRLRIPVILTGDFNTFPNRPDLKNYQFYDGDHVCHILQRHLKDSRDISLLGHVGPLCTSIRDFSSRNNKPFAHNEFAGVIPDHIFVSPGITVIINAVEPCLVDAHFPSDHLPVIADILLPY